MNQNKIDFINKMRRLAALFITGSDGFGNLMNEQFYTNYVFEDTDFTGSDITAAQFNTFITTMQGLLSSLTAEEKQAIYAVKGNSQNIAPPGSTI